ncbi:MAG TPA: 2'-5' RNA ligase family protein [Methylibium sp.]|uniref:2'-5' RNA ligase family protein n=1 Tax=Methylibium sp. TaxID=2067992 RepID=UPI002DB6F304|nr:2'-5' RNA ligase family protein [Methylibium sp.]HEU4459717.1 2'-5' RNA ligase family protein [Methylibium sp.]
MREHHAPGSAPGQAALPGFDNADDAATTAPDDVERQQARTLFFALRPDAPTLEALEARRRSIRLEHRLGGSDIDAERLHVTLYFVAGGVGALPAAMVEGSRAVASGIAGKPFDVVLDGLVTFATGKEREPLVLLASEAANPALLLFQQRIAAAMTAVGLKSPLGRRFTPHLTLLYDARRVAQQATEPIRWTARELLLIESLTGKQVHRVLGRWPVGAAA